jgi:hypothetical protein
VRGDLPRDDAQLNDDFLAGIEHLLAPPICVY